MWRAFASVLLCFADVGNEDRTPDVAEFWKMIIPADRDGSRPDFYQRIGSEFANVGEQVFDGDTRIARIPAADRNSPIPKRFNPEPFDFFRTPLRVCQIRDVRFVDIEPLLVDDVERLVRFSHLADKESSPLQYFPHFRFGRDLPCGRPAATAE